MVPINLANQRNDRIFVELSLFICDQINDVNL